MRTTILTLFALLCVLFGEAQTPADPSKHPLVPPGDGIEVYTSADLKHWDKASRLALHKNNSWGDRWFWAPEVHHIKRKAYLYFDRFNDGLNIWVAELEDDLKTIKTSTLTKCIHVSQPWDDPNPTHTIIKQ